MSWGVGARSLAFGVGSPCTGSLDLIEEKESSGTPNFTQVGRRIFRRGESLEEAKGQLFHLGSTPVFVSGPVKGMKENKDHPPINLFSHQLIISTFVHYISLLKNWRVLLVIAAVDIY